jgi:hypothetical protein
MSHYALVADWWQMFFPKQFPGKKTLCFSIIISPSTIGFGNEIKIQKHIGYQYHLCCNHIKPESLPHLISFYQQ